MDGADFEMPSPKRQKTESPPRTSVPPAGASVASADRAEHVLEDVQTTVPTEPSTADPNSHSQPSMSTNNKPTEEDMLDVLMQHVESEAASKDVHIPGLSGREEQPQEKNVDQQEEIVQLHPRAHNDSAMIDAEPISTGPDLGQASVETTTAITTQETSLPKSDRDVGLESTVLPPGLEPADQNTIDQLRAAAEANDLPPTSETLMAAQIPPTNEPLQSNEDAVVDQPEAREWETDSSPYDSSSDDSSSDSSDDDEDDDEEYTLLDPYEQARILMAEDGGGGGDDANSDDEGRPTANRANAGLRTQNEKPEEILPKPNISITDSMKIEELGSVQAVVENTVVITAKTSGEYHVLESNSLLCTAARIPIGVVAETLGRVEAPLYTVRFASEADIQESGVSEKGTKIYYVLDHSTFVFTQPLKSVKGSDASNFHDEEVGADEMEFSDDEAEAEYKRQMKLKKKGIDPATVPQGGRGGRGGRGQRGRGGRGGGAGYMPYIPESDGVSAYGSGTASAEMNYDDIEDGETDYTPLRRPETMAQTNPHFANSGAMSPPQPQQNSNPRGNFESRGGRGGRGGRGNHNNRGRGGRGGGGYSQNQHQYQQQNNRPPHTQNTTSYSSNQNQNAHSYPPPQPTNFYQPTSTSSMYSAPPPPPSSHFQLPNLPPPPAPQLTPSSGPYHPHHSQHSNPGSAPITPGGMYTIPPSPMTPLPGGQFNFNFNAAQHYQQGQGYQQQQQQGPSQGQWAQYHANLNQFQQQQQQSQGGQNGNADAIAQVQRTLEELRRNAGNGSGGGGYVGGGWNGRQ